MKEINLQNGVVALVSDEDYHKISSYKWFYKTNKTGVSYAYTTICSKGKRKNIYMHRMVLGLSGSEIVDHINRNGLDNRRENLRVCTYSQNMCNSKTRKDNKSGYRGVSYCNRNKKWQAHINHLGGQKNLGLFNTPEEAALKYDEWARKLHGIFANLNFR